MKTLNKILTVLLVVFASGAAFAIEPAGGPASEKIGSMDEFKTQASAVVDEPKEAPVPQRDWLAKGRSKSLATEEKSGGALALNLLAVALVLGLGGGALYLKKRRPASPARQVAQGIKILSQVRVGPKAQLVTTEVAGRVMLLGVTESSVRCLSWLDAPSEDIDVSNPINPPLVTQEPEASSEDFSAGYTAHAPPRPSYGKVGQSATERFREVMNGMLRAQKAAEGSRQPADAPNVAQMLARDTKDVMQTSNKAKGVQANDASSEAHESNVVPVNAGVKATTRRVRRKTLDGLEAQVAGLVARQER